MDNILDLKEQSILVADNSGRSKSIYYVMLLVILMDVVDFASDFAQYTLLANAGSGTGLDADAANSNDERQRIIAILFLVVRIIAVVFFILWFRRAYHNLHRMGVPSLRFSEGWAAGAWFVPFINLARPYTIMTEICENTSYYVHQENPEFIAPPPQTFAGWWWGMYLAASIISNITVRIYAGANTVQELTNSTVANMFTTGLDLIAAVLVLVIIRRMLPFERELYNKQDAIHALLNPAPVPSNS